jgi:hypothetical protein
MRVPVIALALVILASACGDDLGGDGPSGPGRPTGAGEVVVQVMVAGGFVPVEHAVSAVPVVTVLGDGTVITTAPVLAIYPGPAIAPLQSVKVPAQTVDDLVARAGELGLLKGPLDFGRPPVADAPDTTVTVTAGGRTHRHSASALGMGDETVGGQAAANRRALQTFVAATQALPPGRDVWTPPAVAVYVVGSYAPDPNLPQPSQAWPLATPPATTGAGYPCTLVSGADVGTLLDALRRANARTPWMIGGVARSVAFRPVLPGQPDC